MLGTLLGNTAMSEIDKALCFSELICQWREMDKQVKVKMLAKQLDIWTWIRSEAGLKIRMQELSVCRYLLWDYRTRLRSKHNPGHSRALQRLERVKKTVNENMKGVRGWGGVTRRVSYPILVAKWRKIFKQGGEWSTASVMEADWVRWEMTVGFGPMEGSGKSGSGAMEK